MRLPWVNWNCRDTFRPFEVPSDTKCSIFSKKVGLTSARAQFVTVFSFLSFSQVFAQCKNLNRKIRSWWIRVVILCRVSRFASSRGQGNYHWPARFRLSLSNLLGEGWGSVLPKRSAFRLHFHFHFRMKVAGEGLESCSYLLIALNTYKNESNIENQRSCTGHANYCNPIPDFTFIFEREIKRIRVKGWLFTTLFFLKDNESFRRTLQLWGYQKRPRKYFRSFAVTSGVA